MKWIVSLVLSVTTYVAAHAQLFGPESLTGGLIGGIAGGVIGHNSGRKTAEGAAIGAGAGLFLGALTSQFRDDDRPYYGGSTSVVAGPYAYSPRPNYTVTGAVLGGVAGGVIGHNNGRKTAEGIAIGAGAGLLMGGLAEREARARETVYVAPSDYPRTVVVPQPLGWRSHVTAVTVPAAAITTVQAGAAPEPLTEPVVTPITASLPPGSQGTLGSANGLFGR